MAIFLGMEKENFKWKMIDVLFWHMIQGVSPSAVYSKTNKEIVTSFKTSETDKKRTKF